jgi:hypothetical protein
MINEISVDYCDNCTLPKTNHYIPESFEMISSCNVTNEIEANDPC